MTRRPADRAARPGFVALAALAATLALTVTTTASAEGFVMDADIPTDRALVGDPLPAPPNTDPPLRLGVRQFVGGTATPSPLDARPWGFARFLPGGRLLTRSPEGRLEIRPAAAEPGAKDTTPTLVDVGVDGPVSASPDGRHLAYARGPAPAFEIARADDGRVRAVTTGHAPAWAPAISPDGRVVVFVSALSGVPALYRADDDAPPRQLTNLGVRPQPGVVPRLAPFPDAMVSPLVTRDHIVFESRGDVHVLDGEGRPLRVLRGRKSPVWVRSGETFAVFPPGDLTPEIVALPRPRPTPGRP